ncbi:MAG TPA: translocation/assembly module TamB domain-containing protein [Steroidobacteraceae bacterium]
MRRGSAIAGASVLLLAALVGVAAHWLLYTQPGLEFVLRQLGRLPTVQIEVKGVRGTLAGPLEADSVVVDHEAVRVQLRNLRVVSRVRALPIGLVTLDDLVIGKVDVQLKERPERPESDTHFLPAWLRINAPDFRVGDTVVTLQGGQRIVAQEIRGSLHLTRWRLDVDPVVVHGPQGQVDGKLGLRATTPLGLVTDLRGDWRLPGDAFDYRFRLKTRGDLDRLGADIVLDAPARISFSGTLLDLTGTPRAQGTFHLVDVDGSPWVTAGTLPKLTGTIALGAGARSLGFDGTLTSPSLPGQPVRLQGAGRIEARTVHIANFRSWLPRLGLELTASGTVTLPTPDAPEGTLPTLALRGEWTNLRWPLKEDEAPAFTSPLGAYELEGALPYRLSARAQAKGAAIPAVSFEAGTTIDREGIVLDRFDGYALGGRIQGSGSLKWTGAQPWRFDVTARSLNVKELRPGVEGRVDAKGSIAGTGLSATAPWTARLASLSGTLFGRPLTGRGEIAHRDGEYQLRGVRIANGTSHADLQGRIGPKSLDLGWNIDLRSLAIVARDMRGEFITQGTARGTLQRPEVRGSAQLRNFGYGAVTVAHAAAEADIDPSDRRRSHVQVDSETIDVGVLEFDTARLSLAGLLSEHTLEFMFTSPGSEEHKIAEFRGNLRAQGAFDLARRSWSGDLAAADVVFPDGAARLIQPAALVLGPDFQRAAPVCLRTDQDARLCVEGENHLQPASWRVIYSAQDWPLKRVLRSALGWRDFDGRLQASGWAEKAPGKDWVGGSTVLVHEPSFDMPRNKFRTERIQLGSGRFDLYAEPTELRATLDLEIDESTRLQGQAQAERHPGDLLASPLRGRISGASEAIRVLPLLVPEIDRAAGRLEGQITLGGTLGQPQFTGDFHLRDGRLDLYRTNLALSALQLDGTFTGDQLKFTASGATAKGKLTMDGEFSWPEGTMTGSMRLHGSELLVADTPDYRVIASPDIVLHAGVDGYRVDGQVHVPTARISPRELTTSVSTSPDERIVGLEDVEDTGPSTAERVSTRVKVILGDAVRVDAYGLKARLGGDVTVSTVPGDVARGNGTIEVIEGQYKAFGQDVKITKGRLRYVNTPLSEPMLEIVAERSIRDTAITVAVNVRGTLAEPYVSITSDPAMSSNEALSYLLTGRSIDTLQTGEAANVNKAAENLALSGGGALLGGIGTRLGLDEVSVEKTADESDTAVVLGKLLSPKLFVSYGISIAEAINTIKLRYTLNKNWSLKAEAGLEQSADIEYRIER